MLEEQYENSIESKGTRTDYSILKKAEQEVIPRSENHQLVSRLEKIVTGWNVRTRQRTLPRAKEKRNAKDHLLETQQIRAAINRKRVRVEIRMGTTSTSFGYVWTAMRKEYETHEELYDSYVLYYSHSPQTRQCTFRKVFRETPTATFSLLRNSNLTAAPDVERETEMLFSRGLNTFRKVGGRMVYELDCEI
ncbi:hypothetical protein BJ508DRAFT_301561 [Ascobolus immersus RN42]|uniref:Uncharacterized protein n=1 Tax=Ascobolus immersus RN42 TaxID=1160509 RepID=A0A3N4IM29_ASCIM|nr:hypothetical protein BJ508DRAFT_301561 [Ascobolus immersus RN42]